MVYAFHAWSQYIRDTKMDRRCGRGIERGTQQHRNHQGRRKQQRQADGRFQRRGDNERSFRGCPIIRSKALQ